MNLAALYELSGQPAPRDDDTERLRAAAGEDWPALLADPDLMAVFRAAIECRETCRGGRRPDHYTQPSECVGCGPVWLWPGASGRVLGCPWCFNRAAGLPIPRPETDQ